MKDNVAGQHLPTDPELAKRNAESWQAMIIFYERFVTVPSWEWLGPYLQLVKRVVNSKQARLFRAGQSLYHLLISTKERQGLEQGDPFVAVRLERDQLFRIEYSDASGKVVQNRICTVEDDVFFLLEPLLQQLWDETRGRPSTT